MFIVKPLPFVTTFIDALNAALEESTPGWGLSRSQKAWLSFCILAILVTNSVCWAQFERASLGRYSLAALSWMFRHAKIPWERILQMSVRVILRRYGITQGCLDLDDTDKKRSKGTQKIAYVHKLKDKASGGYIQGQCLVFLVLVIPQITFPVGFAFSDDSGISTKGLIFKSYDLSFMKMLAWTFLLEDKSRWPKPLRGSLPCFIRNFVGVTWKPFEP